MGPQEDYIETVVTCEGDFYDPEFHSHLDDFSKRLQDLIETGQKELIVKKVEPWNSVRVTFNIPKEAAVRLKQLAESGNQTLRDLGVLAVQVEGDRLISLTIAGKNNERTELVLQTTPGPAAVASASCSVFDLPSSDELGVPGPSNVETTRKNIAQYLQDGPAGFKNLFKPMGLLEGIKPPESVGAAMAAAASQENMVMPPNHPMFKNLPFNLPGPMSGHPPPGMEHLPFPPGTIPSGFPSPSVVRSQTFSSPTVSHNQSPLSPNYPTPPPSVSNPSSPGLRTPNFPVSVAGTNSALLNNLPRLLGNRDITSSSPLLVNLLQNDVGGLGHMNNFMPNKLSGMPFPTMDIGPPPPKKRRKPRKPKDGVGKASKSPAGQESASGFLGPSSVPQGTVGHPVTPPSGFLPGFAHMSDPQQPSDISGQQTTQEPASNACNTSQINSSAPLITSAENIMNAAQMSSPARMQSPSRGLQVSPGRSVSPRAQSPVRVQSPGRIKSPGALLINRGPGANPQHIVNPVTGKLEPATSPDLARMRAMTKEQSVDSDDMAQTQLQPPPNPLVMLQKNIAASTDSVVVSSLSMVSSRQLSPLPVIPSCFRTDLCLTTSSAPDAQNVPSFGKGVPSSELVQTQLVSSTVTNMATALQQSPSDFVTPAVSLWNRGPSLSVTVPTSNSSVSVASHVSNSVSTVSMVSSCASMNSTAGNHQAPLVVTAITSAAEASTTVFTLAQSKKSSRTPSPVHTSSIQVTTSTTMSYQDSLLPLSAQHPTSSSSTLHQNPSQQHNSHPHAALDSLPQSTAAPVLVTSVNVTTAPTDSSPSGASSGDRASESTTLTVVSSGMTEPLMAAGPVDASTTPVDSVLAVNSSDSVTQGSVNTSDSNANSCGDKSDVKVNSDLCNSSPVGNTDLSTSQDIANNGSLDDSKLKTVTEAAVVPSKLDPESPQEPEHTNNVCPDQATKDRLVDRGICDAQPVIATRTGDLLSNCTGSTNLLLAREDSGSQGTNDPASTNTSPDHEHCNTDGSDTSSLVAHSQGKDSGIADVGSTRMLGKLGYLDKGDDSQGVGSELHTARSNGATTSEATASPLSETDTLSSGHLSQSPSVRSVSVGIASHDSELSSHSFEDQNHESCHVSNAHGNLVLDGVPKLSNASSGHGSLKENDSQSKVDLARHGPASTCTDNSAVITVGYALSRDQPAVNLSQSGLTDKSLPFLTKPSNPFTKESAGLEGYALSERFSSSTKKAAVEPLSWSSKQEFLTTEVAPHSDSQHTNSNGDVDSKDYLNWSKTLNLPPKLLEKVDMTPACLSAKVGSSGLCEVGSEAGLVMGSSARASINGDNNGLHSPGSLYASLSLETGMSRLGRHGNLEYHTKCLTAQKDTRLNNHVHGLLPVNNVKVQINSGLEKAFKQENHVDLADGSQRGRENTASVNITGSGPEMKADPTPTVGDLDVRVASSLLAVRHESRATPPLPSAGEPATCCVATGSTSPSSASTLSPTSSETVSLLGTMAAEVSSPGGPTMDDACSPSQKLMSARTADPRSPNRSTVIVSSADVQRTLANTFGASMVTAVITSTVPIGGATTVTSFSDVGTHPSTAMISPASIPVLSPSPSDLNNKTVLSSVSQVQSGISSVITQVRSSATTSMTTTNTSGTISTVNKAPNPEPQQMDTQPASRPATCPTTKSCRTVSELLAQRSCQSSVVSIRQPVSAISNAVITNHIESQVGNLTPPAVQLCAPIMNDCGFQKSQGGSAVSSESVSLVSVATTSSMPAVMHSLPTADTISNTHETVPASSECHTPLAQCVQPSCTVGVTSLPVSDIPAGTHASHQEDVTVNHKNKSGQDKVPSSQQNMSQNDQEEHHQVNHQGASSKHQDHAADRTDTKSSRGISIMKPLYDREFEIEEELHSQVVDLPSKKPEAHLTEITPNPVPLANLSKSKVQPTVAQILEEADKVRRSQAQLKHNALLMHKVQVDGVKQEVGVAGDTAISVFQNRPTKTALIPVLSAPAPKIPNASFELSRNAHSHIAMNFVQKSLQTPSLYNSTPHPITSPGFAHNLTDSVQKIMNAIPRTDTTPPPSPTYSKVVTTSLPPAPRPRQKSISPPIVDMPANVPTTLSESPATTPEESAISSVQALMPTEDTAVKSEAVATSVTPVTVPSTLTSSLERESLSPGTVTSVTPSSDILTLSGVVPDTSKTSNEGVTKLSERASGIEVKEPEVLTGSQTASVCVEPSDSQATEPPALPVLSATSTNPEQCLIMPHVTSAAAFVSETVVTMNTHTEEANVHDKTLENSETEMAASEHSYSARPPGCTLSPCKMVSLSKQPIPSSLSVPVITSTITSATEHDQSSSPDPTIAIPGAQITSMGIKAISPVKLPVDTKTLAATALTPPSVLTNPGSKVVDHAMVSAPILAGVGKATDVATTSFSGSRLRVISPISKITTGVKDDSEGPRTLVIKIIGAHSAAKDNHMVRTVVKPEAIPTLNQTSPRISPVQLGTTKEANVIDLPSLGKFEQVVESDQMSATSAKRRLTDSFINEPETGDTETLAARDVTAEKSLVPEKSAQEAETEETVNAPSAVDEIFNVAKKQRSPSCDGTCETSSVDSSVTRGHVVGSSERGESPLPRSTRMSTRNNGRRRNSPSDSSTEDKPVHATRSSKRKIPATDDDSSQGVTDKKVAKLEQADTLTDMTLETGNQQATQNDTNQTVSPSSFYNKIPQKSLATPSTKTPSKVNSTRSATPPPLLEKGHSKVRKVTRPEESADVKEETCSNRIRSKTNSVSSSADVEEQETQQEDGLSKEEALGDTKGKRTTRSSKNKEHCELPNAIQGKRRRTSRDHR